MSIASIRNRDERLGRQRVSQAERLAALVFFLIKAPRTVAALVQVLGMPLNSGSRGVVGDLLTLLEAEGLVRRTLEPAVGRGRPSAVWHWVGVQ